MAVETPRIWADVDGLYVDVQPIVFVGVDGELDVDVDVPRSAWLLDGSLYERAWEVAESYVAAALSGVRRIGRALSTLASFLHTARTYPKPLYEGEWEDSTPDHGAVAEPHDGWTPNLDSTRFHTEQGEGGIEPRYGALEPPVRSLERLFRIFNRRVKALHEAGIVIQDYEYAESLGPALIRRANRLRGLWIYDLLKKVSEESDPYSPQYIPEAAAMLDVDAPFFEVSQLLRELEEVAEGWRWQAESGETFPMEMLAKARTALNGLPPLYAMLLRLNDKRKTDDPIHTEDVEVLYHATTKLSDLLANGFRKDWEQSGGLGGSRSTQGRESGVSMTGDLYVAKEIARSFREVVGIANGEYDINDVIRWGRDLNVPEEQITRLTGDHAQARERAKDLGRAREYGTPKTRAYEAYKAMMMQAHLSARTRYDARFFASSLSAFESIDPQDIGVLKVRVDMTDPELWYGGGEREYRVPVRAILGIEGVISEARAAQRLAGRDYHEVVQDNDAYAILDETGIGDTWTQGGCTTYACALQQEIGGDLYTVGTHDSAEHVVLRRGNRYYDADGVSSEEELKARWAELLFVSPEDVELEPMPDVALYQDYGLAYSEEAVKRLRDYWSRHAQRAPRHTAPVHFVVQWGDVFLQKWSDDGDLIGELTLRRLDDDTFRVSWANIRPPYKGQGYGLELYDAALDWAKENRVWVTPDSDISDPARKMWHRQRRSPGVVSEFYPREKQTLSTHILPQHDDEEYMIYRDIAPEDIPEELLRRYRRASLAVEQEERWAQLQAQFAALGADTGWVGPDGAHHRLVHPDSLRRGANPDAYMDYLEQEVLPTLAEGAEERIEQRDRERQEQALQESLPEGWVWAYHGTSSELLPEILAQGLLPRADTGIESDRTIQVSPEWVYLELEGGNRVEHYARAAARLHGGSPVVLQVKVPLDELQPDPDDADLSVGRHQVVIDGVPPDWILDPRDPVRFVGDRQAAGPLPYPDKVYRPDKQWLVSLPVPEWAQDALGVSNGHWTLAYVRGFPQERPYGTLVDALRTVATWHAPFNLITSDAYREMFRLPDGRFEHISIDEEPTPGATSVFTFAQPVPEAAAAMTQLAHDIVEALQSAGFELKLFGEFLPHMSIPRLTAEERTPPPEGYPVDCIEIIFEGQEATIDLGTGDVHNIALPFDEETDDPLDSEYVNPTTVKLPTTRPGERTAMRPGMDEVLWQTPRWTGPNRVEWISKPPFDRDQHAASVSPAKVKYHRWTHGRMTESDEWDVDSFEQGLQFALREFNVPPPPPYKEPSATPRQTPKAPSRLNTREKQRMLDRILAERGGDGDWRAVGFIAPDGSKVMMEFDGQHRGEDHRAIGGYLPKRFSDMGQTDAMNLVMASTGLVRLIYMGYDYAAVDYERPLTSEQQAVLHEFKRSQGIRRLEMHPPKSGEMYLASKRASADLGVDLKPGANFLWFEDGQFVKASLGHIPPGVVQLYVGANTRRIDVDNASSFSPDTRAALTAWRDAMGSDWKVNIDGAKFDDIDSFLDGVQPDAGVQTWFHGTSTAAWEAIRQEGLMPRGERPAVFVGGAAESDPRFLYLAADDGNDVRFAARAAAQAARAAGVEDARALVLAIDASALDPRLLAPDEDARGATTWAASLEMSGTVAYAGTVPPSALQVYAVLEDEGWVRVAAPERTGAALRMDPERLEAARVWLSEHLAALWLPKARALLEERTETYARLPQNIVMMRQQLEDAREDAIEGEPVIVMYDISTPGSVSFLKVVHNFDRDVDGECALQWEGRDHIIEVERGSLDELNAKALERSERMLQAAEDLLEDTKKQKMLLKLNQSWVDNLEREAGDADEWNLSFPYESKFYIGPINGVDVGWVDVEISDESPMSGRAVHGSILLQTGGDHISPGAFNRAVKKLLGIFEHEAVHQYQYEGRSPDIQKGMWGPTFDGGFGTASLPTDVEHARADVEFYPRIVSEVHEFLYRTNGSNQAAREWVDSKTTFTALREVATAKEARYYHAVNEGIAPIADAFREAVGGDTWGREDLERWVEQQPDVRRAWAKWRKSVAMFFAEIDKQRSRVASRKRASHLRPPPAMWAKLEEAIRRRPEDGATLRIPYDGTGWHLDEAVRRRMQQAEQESMSADFPGRYYTTGEPFGLRVKFFHGRATPSYNRMTATMSLNVDPARRGVFDEAMHEITHYVQHLLSGGRLKREDNPAGLAKTRDGNPYYDRSSDFVDDLEARMDAHSISDIEFWPRVIELGNEWRGITVEEFRKRVEPGPSQHRVLDAMYRLSPGKWREAVTHLYNNIFGKGFDRSRTNRPENYADTYEGVQEWVQLGDDPKLPRTASGKITVYHGSNEPGLQVEDFDLSPSGLKGYFGTGLYTTPDFETAQFYGEYVYEFEFTGSLFEGERFDVGAGGGCGLYGDVDPFRFMLGDDEFHCGWYTDSGVEDSAEWEEFLASFDADIGAATDHEGTDGPEDLLWEIAYALKNIDKVSGGDPEVAQEIQQGAARLRPALESFIRAHAPKGERFEISADEIGGEIEAAGFDAVEIPGLERNQGQIEVLVFDPKKTLRLVQVHSAGMPTREAVRVVAAYPPEEDERLRSEVQYMVDTQGLDPIPEDMQAVLSGEATEQQAKRVWTRLYNGLDHTRGSPQMARVKVWSDSVVETFTMDAAYCLYGYGSSGVRTPWCGNRSRTLYENYGGGGKRRFIVLPTGPEEYVELDGQRVPVAKDAYTFAVNPDGSVSNCNDYQNRYRGRGMDMNKGILAAQSLEAAHPWVDAINWMSGSSAALLKAGVEDAEPWLDAGFEEDEIPAWAPFAQAHFGNTDADGASRSHEWAEVDFGPEEAHQWMTALADTFIAEQTHPAQAANTLMGAGLEPETAALWADQVGHRRWSQGLDFSFWGDAVAHGFHPAMVISVFDAIDEQPLRYMDDWQEFFNAGFNARDLIKWWPVLSMQKVDEAIDKIRGLQAVGLGPTDDERVLRGASWIAEDRKRRAKWVTKNNIDLKKLVASPEFTALKDLNDGESPHAYLPELERFPEELYSKLPPTTRDLKRTTREDLEDVEFRIRDLDKFRAVRDAGYLYVMNWLAGLGKDARENVAGFVSVEQFVIRHLDHAFLITYEDAADYLGELVARCFPRVELRSVIYDKQAQVEMTMFLGSLEEKQARRIHVRPEGFDEFVDMVKANPELASERGRMYFRLTHQQRYEAGLLQTYVIYGDAVFSRPRVGQRREPPRGLEIRELRYDAHRILFQALLDGEMEGALGITIDPSGKSGQVVFSEVSQPGRGVGAALYQHARDFARDHNLWLRSDDLVSEAARERWYKTMKDPTVSRRPVERSGPLQPLQPQHREEVPSFDRTVAPELYYEYRSADEEGGQTREAQLEVGYWVSPEGEWHELEDPHGMGRECHGEWAARWLFIKGDMTAGQVVNRDGEQVYVDEQDAVFTEGDLEYEDAIERGEQPRPATYMDVDLGDDYFIETAATYNTEAEWEEKLIKLGWIRVVLPDGVQCIRSAMPQCFDIARRLLDPDSMDELGHGFFEPPEYVYVDVGDSVFLVGQDGSIVKHGAARPRVEKRADHFRTPDDETPEFYDVIPHLPGEEKTRYFAAYRAWCASFLPGKPPDQSTWEVIEVPITDLVAVQDATWGESRTAGPPRVMAFEGRWAIMDGHHRVVAEVLNGAETVQVSVAPDAPTSGLRRRALALLSGIR